MSGIRRVLYVILLLAGSAGFMWLMPRATGAVNGDVLTLVVTLLVVAGMTVWMVFWMMCAVWDRPPGQIFSGLADSVGSLFSRS